jgi:hypothetical protein
MEYVKGQPLNRIMRESGTLPWEEAFRVGEQMARGLARAHDSGIYHRDVKPANIIVNGQHHAYLTDFGIAKVLSADTQLTADGSRLGTPHFMAPERCEGRAATHLSDIYSLGVVLFQSITGKLPFEAPGPAELLERIVADPTKRVRQYCPDVPEDVDRLVAWLMEKNPSHRPTDTHIVTDCLQRVLAGMPLEEEGPNLAGALAEFREDLSTPTPTPSRAEEATTLTGATTQRLGDVLRKSWTQWGGLSFAVQMLVATVVTVVGTVGLVNVLTGGERSPVAPVKQGAAMTAARWDSVSSIGFFRPEAAGLVLATVQLPGFAVSAFAPMAGTDGIVALLEGRQDSTRSGQQALVYINAASETMGVITATSARGEGRIASVMASPFGAQGFLARFEGKAGSPAGAYSWIGAHEGLAEAHDVQSIVAFGSPMGRPGGSLPYQSGPAVASPEGTSLLLALSDDATDHLGWYVAECDVTLGQTPEIRHILTAPGAAIASLSVSPIGREVALERALQDSTAIRVISRSAGNGYGTLMAQGSVRLPADAFSPMGDRLAILHDSPDGPAALRVYDLATTEVVAEVEGGAAMVWLSEGAMAVAAPDRRGDLQVWLVRGEDHLEFRQLTYLTGGIEPTLALSGHGNHVIAAKVDAGPPSVISVELPAGATLNLR